MSAFKPDTIAQAQVDYLVSDLELSASEAVLVTAIGTRASQTSVDGIVSTMGPAITEATADKATSLEVAAARDAVDGHTDTVVGAAVDTLTAALAGVPTGATALELATARDAVNSHTDSVVAAAVDSLELTIAGVPTGATALELATARDAVNSHTDSKTANLDAAVTTRSTPAQVTAVETAVLADAATKYAALLVEIAARATTVLAGVAFPGQVLQIMANQIPAGFSRLGDTNVIPTGGVFMDSAASVAAGGCGDAAYVATGTGAGLWRLKQSTLQKYDVHTNAYISGSAIACPTTCTSATNTPVLVSIGTKLFIAGVDSSSAASDKLYSVETNATTPSFTQLASFPRALSAARHAGIALADGRILFTADAAVGLTVTAAAQPFWLYDPLTNATPTEVIVNLPIAKFTSAGYTSDLVMSLLPSGNVLVVDGYKPVGNFFSCALTITGNSIAAGAAEDTGSALAHYDGGCLLPTATGATYSNNLGAAFRVYVEGSGWGAGTSPCAWGALSHGWRSKRVPGLGWVMVSNDSTNGIRVGMYFTSAPTAAAVRVDAVKL
jgi:hypothetical protein